MTEHVKIICLTKKSSTVVGAILTDEANQKYTQQEFLLCGGQINQIPKEVYDAKFKNSENHVLVSEKEAQKYKDMAKKMGTSPAGAYQVDQLDKSMKAQGSKKNGGKATNKEGDN